MEYLNEDFLKFRKGKLWGIVDRFGNKIHEPAFEHISIFQNELFLIKNNGKSGLISKAGKVLLPAQNERFEIINKNLIFHLKENLWGAIDNDGNIVLDNEFQSWKKITPNFIKLSIEKFNYLFSIKRQKLVSDNSYDNFFAFPAEFVICLLYTSPSPRDATLSRMPSSA